MPIFLTVLVLVVLAAIVFVGYARFVEPGWLRVRRLVVQVDGPLSDFDGLTVLHLSDLHVGRSNRRLAGFLRKAAGLEADFVVITGDFVEGPEAIDDLPAVLGHLGQDGRRPVIGVPGNHDRYRYPHRWLGGHAEVFDPAPVAAALQQSGVTLLMDDTTMVPTRLGEVRIAGVDIWSHGRHGILRALRGHEPSGAILLAHSPDILWAASETGVPLVLAGHTHGGQIRLPWYTPKTGTRAPLSPPSGIHQSRRTWMHVSPGLGTTLVPMRLFARPEATLIELRASHPA